MPGVLTPARARERALPRRAPVYVRSATCIVARLRKLRRPKQRGAARQGRSAFSCGHMAALWGPAGSSELSDGSSDNEEARSGAAAGFVPAEVRRLEAAAAAAAAAATVAAGASKPSFPRGKRKRKVSSPPAARGNMVAQLLGGFKRSAGWDGGAGPVARAVAAGADDAMSPATLATPATPATPTSTGPSKVVFGFAGTDTRPNTTPVASSLRNLLQRTKATAAQQASWQATKGNGSAQVPHALAAKTTGDDTKKSTFNRMPLIRTSSRSPPTLPSFVFSPPRSTPTKSPAMLAVAFSTAADAAAMAPRFGFADAIPPTWRRTSSTSPLAEVAAHDDDGNKGTSAACENSDPAQEAVALQPAANQRLRVVQRAKVRQGKSMKCAAAMTFAFRPLRLCR